MAASSFVFHTPPRARIFRKVPRVTSSVASSASTGSKDVVVVGGGIAGLAVSLALHRLGVSSAILEQGRTLRTGGTSLTLFKNGWRVLDSLGVGDELRQDFLPIQG
jgi:NADPH-dependent 2,4-dienoyl-CoA reductase/sulfur reductase-like enzyme